MRIIKNFQITGKHDRPILTDCFYQENSELKTVVIFSHGYKGFKDWGCWNLIAQEFARRNYFFVKFNFSHNGGTASQPIDFPDLEAFAENNYSKELDDLQSVINYVKNESSFSQEIDAESLVLIGHSRGGGISCIKAAEEPSVTKLISWAGVCDFEKRTATIGDLEAWRSSGVKYVKNGRTKQMMPHNFQFYEDFIQNKERLTIEKAVRRLEIPYLIIHGDADSSVSLDEGKSLKSWCPTAELSIIAEGDHVFGAREPWNQHGLTTPLENVLKKTFEFI